MVPPTTDAPTADPTPQATIISGSAGQALGQVGDASAQAVAIFGIALLGVITTIFCCVLVALLATVIFVRRRKAIRKRESDAFDKEGDVALTAFGRHASMMSTVGSKHDPQGQELPDEWSRHFDPEKSLPYYVDGSGQRPVTWTKPQALQFATIHDDKATTRDDKATNWSKVRRGSTASSWNLQKEAKWSTARDSETGALFYTNTKTGRSTWAAPKQVEFRIDVDGLAYTKKQFAEHYGGTIEWKLAGGEGAERVNVLHHVGPSREVRVQRTMDAWPSMHIIGSTGGVIAEDEEEEDAFEFNNLDPDFHEESDRISEFMLPEMTPQKTKVFAQAVNPLASQEKSSKTKKKSIGFGPMSEWTLGGGL